LRCCAAATAAQVDSKQLQQLLRLSCKANWQHCLHLSVDQLVNCLPDSTGIVIVTVTLAFKPEQAAGVQ
jgi:F0F1-type ATP synthase delta subunit